MTEFVHKTRRALALYPRQHMALVALLLMLISAAALLIPSTPAQAKRTTIALEQPIRSTPGHSAKDSNDNTQTTPISVNDSTLASTVLTPGTEAAAPISTDALLVIAPSNDKAIPLALATPSEEKEWHAITVRNGDTMATIFKRLALSQTVLHALTQVKSYKNAVTKIFPGQQLEFSIANGELMGFKAHLSEIETVVFEKKRDESYRANKIVRVPETVRQYKHAEIKNSLFTAGMEAGLSHTMILELANVLGGEIDFALDPRKGDTIDIIYEEKWLDGQKVGEGEILAASYTANDGDTHSAYRYEDRNGDIGYFSRDGVSARKAFMRAPLDFTRVSSGFNPNRLHPIFKTRRPHRGIDYAAPTGTPVYAAGDGRVVTSSYSGSNGNYVVLQHGAYQTKYLHLSKRFVKAGQRVSQHQLIGAVGATGYATGAHLHYEFLVNGVHQDPGKILKKMPKAVAIAASERARFKANVSSLQTQLAAYQHNYRLAQAETEPASSVQ
jgi:murein DD-endopeptidase MepM/ murein hydrolase activator NlpD